MISKLVKMKEAQAGWIKSKVRFKWKFEDEFEKTIDIVEDFLEKELEKHFKVDSIISWNNNLKIRINDAEQGIQRIVNCVFRYDKTDIKFWYTHIELASSELSKKSKLHYVWKFSITDREKIKEKVLKDLIVWLKEIY
ncbi:MAG: hypothetical protein ACD_49C00050G0013 [uncultured bacterium (gcode 4)]|uniref:Uncharacterized protein n=1 Tax=uncultured bacterium (gcode 4) TaxID=1234023 RepID=K2BC13_9BACT|nr:MAG: hypothetical protein ACD_49C00050G0013 [uncultured bacterium (gcode 4)]